MIPCSICARSATMVQRHASSCAFMRFLAFGCLCLNASLLFPTAGSMRHLTAPREAPYERRS
jgi:hypothetical protein